VLPLSDPSIQRVHIRLCSRVGRFEDFERMAQFMSEYRYRVIRVAGLVGEGDAEDARVASAHHLVEETAK
jgi:hypothetical protein